MVRLAVAEGAQLHFNPVSARRWIACPCEGQLCIVIIGSFQPSILQRQHVNIVQPRICHSTIGGDGIVLAGSPMTHSSRCKGTSSHPLDSRCCMETCAWNPDARTSASAPKAAVLSVRSTRMPIMSVGEEFLLGAATSNSTVNGASIDEVGMARTSGTRSGRWASAIEPSSRAASGRHAVARRTSSAASMHIRRILCGVIFSPPSRSPVQCMPYSSPLAARICMSCCTRWSSSCWSI